MVAANDFFRTGRVGIYMDASINLLQMGGWNNYGSGRQFVAEREGGNIYGGGR